MDELVGAAVGGVEADELGFVRGGVWVGDEICGRVIGEVVFVGGDGFVGFFVEEGDVFAGRYLHGGVAAIDLFGEGFDGVFRLGGYVIDEGAEETPFLEGSDYGLGLVGCVDGMSVAGYYLEEVVQVFEDFVVRGTTVEGACAEGVDGGCFAGVRLGVLDRTLQGCGGAFVDEV